MSLVKLALASSLAMPIAFAKGIGTSGLEFMFSRAGGADRFMSHKIRDSLPFIGRRKWQETGLSAVAKTFAKMRDNNLVIDTSRLLSSGVEGLSGNMHVLLNKLEPIANPKSNFGKKLVHEVSPKFIDRSGNFNIENIDRATKNIARLDKNIFKPVLTNKTKILAGSAALGGYQNAKSHDSYKPYRAITGAVGGALAGTALTTGLSYGRSKMKGLINLSNEYVKDDYWKNRLIGANKRKKTGDIIAKLYTASAPDRAYRLEKSDRFHAGIGKVTGNISKLLGTSDDSKNGLKQRLAKMIFRNSTNG